MTPTEQITTPPLKTPDLEIANDFMALYQEGLRLNESEREEHLQAVAELVGDLTLYEALVAKANEDMVVAKEVATEIWRGRGQEAAIEIERQGFAKLAPRFIDQVTDETRLNTFSYIAGEEKIHPQPEDIKQTTEAEGLQQLYGFLADFYNDTRPQKGVDQLLTLSDRARSILENLSFMGEKELQEAAYGIAAYWKDYLEENPDHQICVLASVSNSSRYKNMRKSDDYFRDRVLQTFSDEELEKYSGRIVSDIKDVTTETDKTKVVLIDDWSISGRELRTVYDELLEQEPFYDFAAAGAVELNLLISSKGRLEDGFKLNPSYEKDLPSRLPVKAYYRSHYSSDSQHEHKGHVTGTHSSVNYDFDKEVGRCFPRALERLNRVRKAVSHVALANIVPPYRTTEPSIEIAADRLSRVDQKVN